jgi:hypothetical protein
MALAVLTLFAGTADAKQYSARRFDVSIRVLEHGTLEVTETVVFQFEDGTFSYVTREIPTGRTDGIEILSASMDGRAMPFGEGNDQVEVTHTSRLRVRWRFEPTAHSTHTFTLKYLARGVVRREDGADLLAWRALPREHAYRIASSTIDLALPAEPLQQPTVLTRRLRAAQLRDEGDRVRVIAQDLRSNGSVEIHVRFPSGAVISALPDWQARQLRAAERGSRWLAAAAVLLGATLIVLFALRQNYDTPPRDTSVLTDTANLPDMLPAPVAGALATDGRPRTEHAIATVIALADRGDLSIAAEPRGFLGQRDFTVTRARGAAPLAGYEHAVIETVFGSREGLHESARLSAAHGRLARSRRFSRAMEHHLIESGFMDEGRKAVRNHYAHIAWVLFALGSVSFIGSIIFLRHEHGLWAMAIPGALFIAATIAGIFHHSTTALSNDGRRRAHAWRAYRRHLRAVAREREPLAGNLTSRLLPFAVAFGLASVWAKYAEHTAAAVPAWFQAAATDSRAFTAFVAASGHGAHGGGGGAGAAGGGSSGAG